MKLDKKTEQIWLKAGYCNCGEFGCSLQNHRLCAICGDVMFYDANNEAGNAQRNNRGLWTTGNIVYNCDTNNIKNLYAIHVRCKNLKGD